MQQQTISVTSNPKVTVHSIPGDLRVAGWKRNELMAKTDGGTLNVATGEIITISCDEDLILYLPSEAELTILEVCGDASLQALRGAVKLGSVAGDLSLRDTGAVVIESVAGDISLRGVGDVTAKTISGDFSLYGARGSVSVESIGSDASLRDVEGSVALPQVGSDIYVRNVRGGVTAVSGSDAALYLQPQAGAEYHITAGDDIILRLPADASAELHLTGGSPEAVHVDFPGVTLDGENASYDITVGSGAAKIFLTAGDELVVTSRADQWDSAADFGVGMRDGIAGTGIPPIPPIPPLPPDFSERINEHVRAATEQAQARIEVANQRIQVKVDAAMRRAGAKARAAEARARRGQANMNIGRWQWDLTPHGPAQKAEPVSEDERLIILKMLQEKKISLEEAENLLAALEGK